MRILIAALVVSAAGWLASVPSLAGGVQQEKQGGQPKEADPKQEPDELPPITIKDKITRDDPFDVKRVKCHRKVHIVKMKAGYQYLIDMKAERINDRETFDTFLRLEDAAGTELDENDDYISTDSRIVFTPKQEGAYRIIATTFDNGFTGSYTLTIAGFKAGVAGAAPGVVLNVNGTLTANDPFDPVRGNRHHKVHTLKMAPGKTYTIDLMSMQFDAWLRLEGQQGNQLAQDDDGGEGLNSRIVFTPTKNETYRIIVTTFGAGATGMYTLKVTAK